MKNYKVNINNFKKGKCIIMPLAGILLALAFMSCEKQGREHEDLFKAGVELYLKKDLKGSAAYFKKSIDLNPGFDAPYIYLAKIYYFENRDSEFEGAVNRYLDLKKDDLEGLKLLARWNIRKDNRKEAKRILEKVLQISGNDVGALYLLGTVYYLEDDYSNAIVTFSKTFSSYPYFMQIHEKMEKMYRRLGLLGRADINREMLKNLENWQRGNKYNENK